MTPAVRVARQRGPLGWNRACARRSPLRAMFCLTTLTRSYRSWPKRWAVSLRLAPWRRLERVAAGPRQKSPRSCLARARPCFRSSISFQLQQVEDLPAPLGCRREILKSSDMVRGGDNVTVKPCNEDLVRVAASIEKSVPLESLLDGDVFQLAPSRSTASLMVSRQTRPRSPCSAPTRSCAGRTYCFLSLGGSLIVE